MGQIIFKKKQTITQWTPNTTVRFKKYTKTYGEWQKRVGDWNTERDELSSLKKKKRGREWTANPKEFLYLRSMYCAFAKGKEIPPYLSPWHWPRMSQYCHVTTRYQFKLNHLTQNYLLFKFCFSSQHHSFNPKIFGSPCYMSLRSSLS